MDILDIKTPLSSKEIESIFKAVKKPDIVGNKIFQDVLRRIGASRISQIKGVEDDPLVKTAYEQHEINEETKRRNMSLKLTDIERRHLNFPSVSKKALPKHFTEDEKIEHIKKWVKTLQDEIDEVFNIEEIKVSQNEVHLTEKQIEDALECIDYTRVYRGDKTNVVIDPDIAESAAKQVKKQARMMLKRVKLRPERISRFIELFCQRFERALALPGKRVGNIAAASFGEAATQQSLNTFHFAGDRGARKQITGFAAFETIIEVKNPKSPTMTIFTNERFTGDQMRLRIPFLQMTTLRQVIENHRIFKVTLETPIPRWEQVYNAINMIDPNIVYPTGDRRNIIKPERVLEIKLDIQEMFFRRLSMGQIANAIEERNPKVRVVTSNMRVGLIYIYYDARDIEQESEIPEFATEDPFTFFLKNAYYPKILDIQLGGIWGIDHTYVRYYEIKKAIDFSASFIKNGRVTLVFKEEEVYLWALTNNVVSNFLVKRLTRFLKKGGDLAFDQTNVEEHEYSFNIGDLQWYDYETNEFKPFTYKDIKDALLANPRIPIYELLDFTKDPVGRSENGKFTVLRFDKKKLDDLGFELSKISNSLGSIFKAVSKMNLQTSEIYLDKVQKDGQDAPVGYMIGQLKEILEVSDTLEQNSVKWYYDVEGSNLDEVFAHPLVDCIHSRTNNIIETFRSLGAEACRSILLQEITANVSSGMNPIHIDLLADSLVARAIGDKPLSQNRHGLKAGGREFLARAGFEEITKVFVRSGMGQVDNLESLSSQIMLGMLKSTGGLTETDKEVIFKDSEVFKFDFPEKQIGHTIKIDKPTTKLTGSVTKVVKPKKQKKRVRVGRRREKKK